MKKLISSITLVSILLASQAYSASPEEELYEALCAIRALARQGITQSELSSRMNEVFVKEDKYVRSGGDNQYLKMTVINYKLNLENWTSQIKFEKMRLSTPEMKKEVDEVIQLGWKNGENNLKSYEEEKFSKKTPARRGTKEKK